MIPTWILSAKHLPARGFAFLRQRLLSLRGILSERNHWEHDTQLTVNRSTKRRGTDLCAEHSISSLRDRIRRARNQGMGSFHEEHIEVRGFISPPVSIVRTTTGLPFIPSSTTLLISFVLYAHLHWEVLRIIYGNSVRYRRQQPSAPSFGVPMLAANSKCLHHQQLLFVHLESPFSFCFT